MSGRGLPRPRDGSRKEDLGGRVGDAAKKHDYEKIGERRGREKLTGSVDP